MDAKFSAGQRVSILRSGTFSAPTGIYRVIRAYPADPGPRRYRVKNEAENFERVMDEARLEAAAPD
ncbi:MAG: hypothetical protein AB7P07_09970 [Hyphomonadaceae bacterium]